MNTTNNKQNNKNSNPERISFDDFDRLNLKPFAENLLQNMEKGTASSIGEPGAYTISLNAEFGNGKTTFLEMFKHFIEDEKSKNYNIISINAWESDFYKEPVIAILSELANYMIKNNGKNEKKIIETIGRVGTYLASEFIKSKIGIDPKKIETDLKKKGDNLLQAFNQRKEAIKDIKIAISKHMEDKTLLIIVDELDRARPDYAIRFLEDIKHFFNIKNVVFLVAVNRSQMEATVKCLYGENLDFDGYYRKFFKQEMDLPDPYKEAQRLIDDLIKKTEIKYTQRNNDIHRPNRIQYSYLSCKMFNLTLREIEYFIRIFDMILSNKDRVSRWTYMDCYSFFICLFIKEKKVFNKILDKIFTIDNFFQFVDNKNFKYGIKPMDDSNKETDLEIDTNCLLGTIACSFIEDQDSLKNNRKKIQTKFKAREVDYCFQRHLGGIPGGFILDYGQPAFDICKKINQCKSMFS